MEDLRYTDTNAADDSAGRAFGLDGNLYMPAAIAVVGALIGFTVLNFVFHAGLLASGLLVALPLAAVLGWILFLKHNRPAGYDRDLIATWCGGGDFTRGAQE